MATELDSRFQHELEAANIDIRRQAALSAFQKLRPSNEQPRNDGTLTADMFLLADDFQGWPAGPALVPSPLMM